ncbi:MAG: hypothetical protein Q7T26_11950 [Dehalococcoidia bacterium]|nr:hypothetical protein [Dehalococcoidia bacterium]
MNRALAPLLRHPVLALSAGIGLLYVAIALLWPSGVFWSPDSNLKYVQMLSLRWDDGLRFDMPYPGRALDPDLQAVPLGPTFYEIRQGNIHIVWPLLFAAMSLPFYLLFGHAGLFLLPAASGAGTVYLTGRLTERLRPGAGVWAALVLGLTTPVLFYSVMFWEHTVAVSCATLGAYLLLTARDGSSSWRLAFAGAAIAFAAGGLRAEMYVFAAGFFLAVLLFYQGRARWATLLPLAAGAVVTSLPLWTLNYITNGSPLPLNAAKNFSTITLDYLSQNGMYAIVHLLVGDGAPLEVAFLFCMAAAVAIAVFQWTRGPGRGSLLNLSLIVLSAAAWVIFAVSLPPFNYPTQKVFNFHGFLAISPFLVFGMLTRVRALDDAADRTRRMLALATFLYAVLYLVSISLVSAIGPNGGALEWGPRFFLGIYPLLTVLAVTSVAYLLRMPEMAAARRGLLTLAVVLALAGTAFQTVGLLGVARDVALNRDLIAHVRALPPEEPIVTDSWWMPVTVPTEFFSHRMLFLPSAEQFRDWVPKARDRGMRSFRMVSFTPGLQNNLLRPPWPEGIRLESGNVQRAVDGLYFVQIRVQDAGPTPQQAR